jgi:heat shock protein HtpX
VGVLDKAAQRRHQHRNWLHSLLLLGGLAILVAIPAFAISGVSGLIIAAVLIVGVAMMAPRVPITALMQAFKAREVPPDPASGLVAATHELARRASLPRPPRLFIIPSQAMNAFATGTRDNAAIALTRGLMDALSPRELTGVIAHEISHIRNNDLWIMNLADLMSRFTLALSYSGIFLAVMNVLAVLSGQPVSVPWIAVAILYISPALSSLLQLALSRAREYDADLEGALLTGDPRGLALALEKIERLTGSVWQDLAFPAPGRRVPQPSLLRTHPSTKERVARLMELMHGKHPPLPNPIELAPEAKVAVLVGLPKPHNRPRYRFPGIWY